MTAETAVRLPWLATPPDYQPFPDIEAGEKPVLYRVLIQMKSPLTVTKGGIHTADETQAHDMHTERLGRIVALGPLAFCNRDTGQPWGGEEARPKVGQYVRIQGAIGRSWKMKHEGREALFTVVDDLDMQTVLTYDPT